jgi:hypothetical protein
LLCHGDVVRNDSDTDLISNVTEKSGQNGL